MQELRTGLQKTTITDSFYYELSKSLNGDHIYLKIDYLNGKYLIERTFKNCLSGRDDLEDALKNLGNEQGLKKYLNIK
jgi:hypothetical protein